MVTESKELALDDREFELFVRAAQNLDCDLRSQETVFVAFVLGRLGLRPGELCHIHSDWINWRRRMIEIPAHDPCDKGKDGGLCGSCKQAVRQKVDYAKMDLAEARMEVLDDAVGDKLPRHVRSQIQGVHFAAVEGDLSEDDVQRQLDVLLESAEAVGNRDAVLDALDNAAHEYMQDEVITFDEAEALEWSPKNPNASRDVPFDFDARAELVVERFFDRFERWPESQTTINRRVDTVLQQVDGWTVDKTTPHGLRATAATHASARGLSPLPLQAMFGWSDISTARNYVAASSRNTQRQLHQIYSQ
ncbi:tyrosine-type recombinase/integrase [Haloarcula onubensis]|uniref:Tyrosine-type recombinase/integrase n=1 Tax=Haloarcula onubensis TaxID=2950539 RepID=A0ABU2FWM9_9EURY|nr:tyrosine-type recombinase/integrase [Halomicroarcula sp. S3CR25-11]MDS0284687.1 tyrosine-type recombinase/integrase [Halomicroarcula sp. S3CR25-11]